MNLPLILNLLVFVALLLGLAQTAGFNSKSAFIAAFKRHTGLTPSAWAAQNAPHIAK